MYDGLRIVEVGTCSAWPLPSDATCARLARHMFRQAADGLSLDPALTEDGVTMVSELAANTLHVNGAGANAASELWLYLRGAGPQRELVCKVFDSYPGWLYGTRDARGGTRAGMLPGGCHVPPDAAGGRGLQVVRALSGGRWGYHLTRARLGGWDVRGKAVWFAVPVAVTRPQVGTQPAAGRVLPADASEAMTELEAGLAARGFAGKMLRADDRPADMAILSVCSGLTVWCRAGSAWLRAAGAVSRRWGYADLVEVAELIVQAYATLHEGAAGPQLAGVTGALTPASPAP